ncbi:hypothetical protein VaNZ11_004340 [Volvox africanus]|uniref:Histone-binding protein RBBP4 N-terminal domain-containing protein n=1 Tax=Volvox africanus TaxID=51714 RepID=A0ABQ5RXB6_9CHLO|nr:hypothetical protein VaNZ11_004340 [Volvox africanus]
MDSAAELFKSLSDEDCNGRDTALLSYVQVLQRWKVWLDNVPLFYSACVQFTDVWPSNSIQLYPHIRPEPTTPGLSRNAVLYCNRRESDDVPLLILVTCLVDGLGKSRPTQLQQDKDAFRRVCSFTHTIGDIDRLRYCPQRPTLVAVKSAGTALSLYDVSPALSLLDSISSKEHGTAAAAEEEDEEVGHSIKAGDDQSRSNETGGEDEEPTGAHGSGTDGGGPISVLESPAQEDVSLAWGCCGPSGGGDDGGMRLFSGLLSGAIGEYALREDGSLAEVTVRRGGHDADATVVDLAWGGPCDPGPHMPTAEAGTRTSYGALAASGLLGSAGTDGRTLLWDPRQRQPALQAPRCRRDVNTVAFAGAADAGGCGDGTGPLLATAGDEGIIRIYDIRMLGNCGASACGRLSSTAGVTALHRLKAHNCRALQVSFSPHSRSLLASSDDQGRVLLWDLDRTTRLDEGLNTRPQLLFVHAGHPLPVDDFSWSTELFGTLASVSGSINPEVVAAARAYPGAESDLPQPPSAVQVWRPSGNILPPDPHCKS